MESLFKPEEPGREQGGQQQDKEKGGKTGTGGTFK